MTAPDNSDAPTRRRAGLTSGPLSMLTREVGRMTLLTVSTGLTAWERTRGIRHFALRRGNEVLEIVAHTPLGRLLPHPVINDGADDEAARISTDAKAAVRRTTQATADTAQQAAQQAAAKTADKATDNATDNAVGRTAEKAATTTAPTSARPKPPRAAVEAGAPGVVTDEVERVTEQLAIEEPTSRDELPIPDFDNISLGSLRARLRSLSLEQLVVLREWEQAHAHRLPVITLLDNRIAKVSAEQPPGEAYPSDGAPAGTPASA